MKPWIKYSITTIAILLVVGLSYGYVQFKPLANTGTGLVAHQMCSCLYVSNRQLDVCLDDRWPDMSTVMAEPIEDNGVIGVRASSIFAVRTATFEEGFGCTLQD